VAFCIAVSFISDFKCLEKFIKCLKYGLFKIAFTTLVRITDEHLALLQNLNNMHC